MNRHDDYLTQDDPGHWPENQGDVETMAMEVRAEQHRACLVCKADVCMADEAGFTGRENCPCDGDGAVPVVSCDGEALCSEACRSTWEAEGRPGGEA